MLGAKNKYKFIIRDQLYNKSQNNFSYEFLLQLVKLQYFTKLIVYPVMKILILNNLKNVNI